MIIKMLLIKANVRKSGQNGTTDGGLDQTGEYKFEYEHINTALIEHSNVYQLFYVFEIGDGQAQPLFYATEPTEPIQTRAFTAVYSASRDKITLWIVIAVCVLSALFLVGLIATLIVLTLIKYKPSKFHKAAQIVGAGANVQAQSKIANGMLATTPGIAAMNGLIRSKFDRTDDFLGEYLFCFMRFAIICLFSCWPKGGNMDFAVPAAFSRHDMTTMWLVKHANGDLILDEEYRNLPDYRDIKTSHASQEPKNECKNRFLDIKAYDDSRVVLQVSSVTKTPADKSADLSTSSSSSSSSTSSSVGVDGSLSASISSGLSHMSHAMENDDNGDYINANFVQGYSHDKKFIATQGPKKETLVDFWRMIYQYQVSAIVMLTKLIEKGNFTKISKMNHSLNMHIKNYNKKPT